jgi:hypothetical protein
MVYRRLTVVAFAVALLVTGSLAGCTAPKPPETAPEGFEFDKASLTITKDTEILKPVGNGYQVVTLEEPIEGLFVDAWVTGPVRESYPVQADADVVVLLD